MLVLPASVRIVERPLFYAKLTLFNTKFSYVLVATFCAWQIVTL